MTPGYWHRDVPWCDRYAGAPLPVRCDFAVLGAGFAGLMTAIELRVKNPGATIVVLEAERVGFGASGRNAGFLSPLAAPVWLLGAERSPDHAWGAQRMNAEMHAVARWIGAHVHACELAPVRYRMVPRGRVFEASLVALARAAAVAGIDHRMAERAIEMDAYTLHPYKLVVGLAAHAAQEGVQIHEHARVQRIDRVRAGGALVHLARHVMRAEKVIVCTNAYTSPIELGERVRALVFHSCMVSLRGPRVDGFTLEVGASQTYHRMHGDNVIYGGPDKLRAPRGDELDALVRDRFPGADIDARWSGPLHATANGLPIIRTSEQNDALVLNVGYGGTGVALTLGLARLAASVASNGRFANADDARMLSLIHTTRLSVRDGAGAIARIATAYMRTR